MSPGGVERCWEIHSPDLGDGSVRGRLLQCVKRSYVHLHGYLVANEAKCAWTPAHWRTEGGGGWGSCNPPLSSYYIIRKMRHK